MHCGSLVPKFVFEGNGTSEPGNDDMNVYMRWLICVLCRRFILIPRPSDPGHEFEDAGGVPREGTRYWWLYWDNQGNDYDVSREKYRVSNSNSRTWKSLYLIMATRLEYLKLKMARESGCWMRIPANITSTGKEYTNRSAFFDHAWEFIHHGSTRVHLWDANLHKMKKPEGTHKG